MLPNRLSMRWFLGRDLRTLTPHELKTAYDYFQSKLPLKSRLSSFSYQNVIHEMQRRIDEGARPSPDYKTKQFTNHDD